MKPVPPPYDALIELITLECGIVFDANPSNLALLSKGMGWTAHQVRAALAVMRQQGFVEEVSVRGNCKLRRYRVTTPVTAAA